MARTRVQAPATGAVIVSSIEEVAELVSCLRSEGKAVVLANGAFDLLHVGHLRCLRDAKGRGDYLLVGVNSDASIKKYKHAKLPVVPEADRAEIVAGLRWVDYVVIFDGETADELIATVKPDIVAKGTDYTEETIPERETIEEVGASIAIVGDEKSHGSSKIVQRIRRLKW